MVGIEATGHGMMDPRTHSRQDRQAQRGTRHEARDRWSISPVAVAAAVRSPGAPGLCVRGWRWALAWVLGPGHLQVTLLTM